MNQNEEIYINYLTDFLIDEFQEINTNTNNNKYTNIDDYIEDVKKFEIKMKESAKEGPNKFLHINTFILEQILNDYETLLNNFMSDYDSKLNNNNDEINKNI